MAAARAGVIGMQKARMTVGGGVRRGSASSLQPYHGERRYAIVDLADDSHHHRGAGAAGIVKAADLFNMTYDSKLEKDKEYNVEALYFTPEESIFASVATDADFKRMTLIIIWMSGLYMFFDADYNDSNSILSAHPYFIGGELFFIFYFTIEIAFRYLAFRDKKDALRDTWFKIDFWLVVSDYLTTVYRVLMELVFKQESWYDGLEYQIASVKLSKLIRVVRILKESDSVLSIIRSLYAALKPVSSVTIYVFSNFYSNFRLLFGKL